MLTFSPISTVSPGTLARIIRECYARLKKWEPEFWRTEIPKWEAFDRNAFLYLETVGQCVFLTCFKNNIIGLGSFDPRGAPKEGIVGQNCILPSFRNQGIGSRQIQEICTRLKQKKIRSVPKD